MRASERSYDPALSSVMKRLGNAAAGHDLSTLQGMRAFIDTFGSSYPIPADIRFDPVDANWGKGEWVTCESSANTPTVLHLHGGGFCAGSIVSYRRLAADLAIETNGRVLIVDYRRGPEHPFPAAVEDCVAAYRWLVYGGISPKNIVVSGDSAGGGLVLSLMLSLKERGDPQPACGICMSPWVDLQCQSKTMDTKATEDPLGTRESLLFMADQYLAGADPRNPLASPLYGNLADLPPVLIQVGSREILLDDSRILAKRAAAAGMEVTLEEWKGMIHVFQMMADDLEDGPKAFQHIHRFVHEHTQNIG